MQHLIFGNVCGRVYVMYFISIFGILTRGLSPSNTGREMRKGGMMGKLVVADEGLVDKFAKKYYFIMNNIIL